MNIKDIRDIKLKNKEGVSKGAVILAAATGVAVGVGATAVAVKALSNKKTRAKVKEALSGARSQVSDSIDAIVSKAQKNKDVKKVIIKGKKQAKRKIASKRASKK